MTAFADALAEALLLPPPKEGLMAKVRETPEWKELMQQGAFNTTSLTGDAFRGWLTREEERHRTLMQEAGFLANPS